MAAQDIAEDIWAGLISDGGTVVTEETLFARAEDELLNDAVPPVTSTDIARAAAVVVGVARVIPADDARDDVDGDVSTSALTTVLDDFARLYTKIRVFTFHQSRTGFGQGNPNPVTPDYTRRGYQSSLAGSAGSITASLIEDDVDLSDYVSVISALRTHISTEASGGGGTINYCHSSCHNACHGSRGRR